MSLVKGTVQKLYVFAFATADHATITAGEPVTGDAANITCKVAKEGGGTLTALDDTNPTEEESGWYLFDLTATETNASSLHFIAVSSTTGVQVIVRTDQQGNTLPQNHCEMQINGDGFVGTDHANIDGTTSTVNLTNTTIASVNNNTDPATLSKQNEIIALVNGAQITVVSPTATDGSNISVLYGQEYSDSGNSAGTYGSLTFSIDGTVTDLTNVTSSALNIYGTSETALVTVTDFTVSNGGLSSQQVKVAMTPSETAIATNIAKSWRLTLSWASGNPFNIEGTFETVSEIPGN